STCVRGQEYNRPVEIVWQARTLKRYPITQVLHPFAVFIHHDILSGLEPTGCKAIHGDAVDAPIIRQAHRQLLHAAAACSIGSQTRRPGDASDRTDVDDAAVFFWDHMPWYGLRDEEGAAQVGVQN